MANTISIMSNAIRNAVSKKRIRYKEDGFNLDLTYICKNIIAMGYPAPDKLEGIYRNPFDEVYKLLEKNHENHYKIYNLCEERKYDSNKFHGRVSKFPFEDHNPPTIELIQKFCDDVDNWLKADSENVVAVHCKAGKGRTGTMICAYLVHSGFKKTADEALAWYDEKRTKDRKGVTIPSQRRYVQYYSNLIPDVRYKVISLYVCEIRFAETSCLHNYGTVECSISDMKDSDNENVKAHRLKTWTIDFQNSSKLDISNSPLLVSGDIKVELTQKSSRKQICHLWVNTFFVQNYSDCESDGTTTKFMYTLNKSEIDGAHKDKDHKLFSKDFKISIVFEEEKRSECTPAEPSVKNKLNNKRNSEGSDISSPSSSRFFERNNGPFHTSDETTGATKSHQMEPNGKVSKSQYEKSTISKFPAMVASKRKQSSSKPSLLSGCNTPSSQDIKKQHIFNQPSVTQSGSIKWQNDENRSLFDRCNIPKSVVAGSSDKNFEQDPYLNCKRSSPIFSQDGGEGDEDWESGRRNSNARDKTSTDAEARKGNSQQKLKMKYKKSKVKLAQWIQNYFRSDPINFFQKFMPHDAVLRSNSNIYIRGIKIAKEPATTKHSVLNRIVSLSCPNILNLGSFCSMKIISKSKSIDTLLLECRQNTSMIHKKSWKDDER